MDARNETELTKPEGVVHENLRREENITDSLLRRERLFSPNQENAAATPHFSHVGFKEMTNTPIARYRGDPIHGSRGLDCLEAAEEFSSGGFRSGNGDDNGVGIGIRTVLGDIHRDGVRGGVCSADGDVVGG